MRSICESILLKPMILSGAEMRFLRKNLSLKINEFAKLPGMGHGSKKMAYEVYGNDVEGLEEDGDKIWDILAMTSMACEKESLHFHYRDWAKSQ